MKPVILIVLDGYGIAPPGPGNAVTLANPQHINSYITHYPSTTLQASGEAVGLPPHEVGNTEVGHINLGAGRVVYQDLPRINTSIADGSFYKNAAFLEGLLHLRNTKGNLHIIGLVGEGSVHSNIDHLFALLYFAKENNIKNLFLHVITDGRDSPPQSAIEIITRLEDHLTQLNYGKIATVSGRYYAMDRDHRWERTERAYRCMTEGVGEQSKSALDAIKKAYESKKTDEFIEPTNIMVDGVPVGLVQNGDAVIFLNFRIDRPRQLTKAFVLDHFEEEANKMISFDPYEVKYYKTHRPQENLVTAPFKRQKKVEDLFFITMTEYEKQLPAKIAFPPITVEYPLARVLSEAGLRQLHISESEKERFVTFYFNGQNEAAYPNEDRVIIPSPKVSTYDLQPEMSAAEVTDVLIKKLDESYQFILLNFANPDMVGHTGNIEASVKAIHAVDDCLGKIIPEAEERGYAVIITADHGNVEQKINLKTGNISTEHTGNPVPLIIIDEFDKKLEIQPGILADVAPTILTIMGVPKPHSMTGRSLLGSLV